MTTTKYKVYRDSICLGFVVEIPNTITSPNLLENKEGVVPHPNGLGIHIKSGQLYIPNGQFLRMMLFIPTQEGKASDLQWDSENYPIINLSSKSDLAQLDNPNIAIDSYCKLGPLLKHFGYANKLNANDISDIVSRFFNTSFAFSNCDLFGYQKVHPQELRSDDYDIYKPSTFSEGGRPVIYRSKNVAYVKTFDGILPSEYFEFLCAARPLSNMGEDISMLECTQNGRAADKFEPHPTEANKGLVKILCPREPHKNPTIYN